MPHKKALVIMLAAAAFVFSSGLRAGEEEDREAIRGCLKAWGDSHPFGKANKVPFKTISTSVKIIGIGKDISDEEKTEKPRLVLIKPTVSVLTKTAFRLMNPNGWYCFKSNVTVLGKSEITAHCKAHLASSRDGVTVAGSSDEGGVTVLGKAEVKREGCGD